MVTDNGKKTIVVEWMQSYVDSYLKKDKRNMQGALNRFKSFLLDRNKQNLTFSHLTELIISDFQDCLVGQCKGEGASSYFSRFKRMVKQAYRSKLIQQNPAADVRTIQGKPMPKDILTKDEMENLANTPVSNFKVKVAFLFSCCTGLRWCDVRDLKWQNINLQEGTLSIRQNKTKQGFTLPLNNTAKALLESLDGKEEKVFNLPSANGANKTLKAWVKKAEISKKITWHNARHSAGTNLIIEGEDATTVREFLGHASTGYVFRYVKVGKAIKNRAADKLNFKI